MRKMNYQSKKNGSVSESIWIQCRINYYVRFNLIRNHGIIGSTIIGSTYYTMMERYCKVIPENFCISSLMKLTLILEYVNTKIIYIFFFERYCKIFHFISYEIKPQFGIREYVNTKIIYRFFFYFTMFGCWIQQN
jgi:hypothetical protein